MKRIDAINLARPFAGSRMLRDMLNREGFEVGRRHVATLMQRMGIEALYRKPNTSKKHPTHRVYPYLLRELKIERANQVWATDITYIPMACGWVYLCAIVDWASRRVLSHRVSISMDASFCVEALEEAFSKYGQPEIFNSDQGSQFTSEEFTEALKGPWRRDKHGWPGSMEGQHFRGTALAFDQIRRGLPPRLRLGQPGQDGDLALHRFLQHCAPSFVAEQEDPGRVLLRDVSADPIVPVSSRSESAVFSSTSLSPVYFKEVLKHPSSCPRSWSFVRGRTAASRPSVQPESPHRLDSRQAMARRIFKPADLMHVRTGAHTRRCRRSNRQHER